MPRLILLQPNGTARQIHLGRTPFTVGRDAGCDLAINDAELSRLHAVFELVAGAIQIRDMGSRNGVFVNGKRVRTKTLHGGEDLRLGPCVIRYLATGGDLSPTLALRLVTIPGQLSDMDCRKMSHRPRTGATSAPDVPM